MALQKPLGKVLYVEFRRESDGKTHQYIVAPECVDPSTGKVLPLTVLSRLVDKEHPRRGWRIRKHPVAVERKIDASTGQIDQSQYDLSDALSIATDNLEPIHLFLASLPSSDWKVYKSTLLAIEMTATDVAAIANASTPAALKRRLDNARIAAGFDKALFPGGPES